MLKQDEDFVRADSKQSADLHALIDHAKINGEINPQLPTEWVAACFDNLLMVAWSLVHAEKSPSTRAKEYVKLSLFEGCGT